MNSQRGFTLLELVIAMAIFAVLGLASWRLFDSVVRVQQTTASHERAFRSLQRAVAVIERDLLHITEQPVVLNAGQLSVQRQKLLEDVIDLRWRLLDDSAMEFQLSTRRYDGIRRVLLLPGALP